METPRNPRLKTRYAVGDNMCNHCDAPTKTREERLDEISEERAEIKALLTSNLEFDSEVIPMLNAKLDALLIEYNTLLNSQG